MTRSIGNNGSLTKIPKLNRYEELSKEVKQGGTGSTCKSRPWLRCYDSDEVTRLLFHNLIASRTNKKVSGIDISIACKFAHTVLQLFSGF